MVSVNLHLCPKTGIDFIARIFSDMKTNGPVPLLMLTNPVFVTRQLTELGKYIYYEGPEQYMAIGKIKGKDVHFTIFNNPAKPLPKYISMDEHY